MSPTKVPFRYLELITATGRVLEQLMKPSHPAFSAPREEVEEPHRCEDGDERPTAELLAKVAKSLGHRSRVAIVAQLAGGRARSAGEIVEESGLAQSTVSQHLQMLCDAGIVKSRRDGSRVWYWVDEAALRRFAQAVDAFANGPCPIWTLGPIGNRRSPK